MKNVITLLIACLLAMLLIGCGGGGGGDGDGGGDGGGDLLLDDQLFALWYLVDITENDVIQPLASTAGWQSGVTSQTLEMKDDGKIIRRSYTGTTLTLTEDGTYTTQDQAGSWTFGGVTTNFTYGVWWADNEPWVANIVIVENGHTYQAQFVKVVALVQHSPDLIRTWATSISVAPSQVKVDNVETPIIDYFGMQSDSDAMTIQLLADGTATRRELRDHMVVARDTGNWSTGGGTFELTLGGKTIRGIVGAGGFSWTFLDPDLGKTILIIWAMAANPAENHPAELVGKWEAAGVTMDGAPMDLATFFEWESGVTSLVTEFWSDGVVESRNYKGSVLNESEFGTWDVTGIQIRMQMVDLFLADYQNNGNVATMTITQDGHVIVLTFNKMT